LGNTFNTINTKIITTITNDIDINYRQAYIIKMTLIITMLCTKSFISF